MKLLLLLLALIFTPGILHCQDRTTDERIIEGILSSGGYDGGAAKILGRMGDAAAVVVTKILGENNIKPNDVENILAVIHLSFSAPILVESPMDREPRATLFLLRDINSVTTDQKIKQRIAEERKFVLDQVAKPIKNNTP
jgi:hypothetical protein